MNYIILVWVHFLADFIMQSDKMAINKSSSLKYLGLHSLVYSLPFLCFGVWFAVISGVLHFIIDFGSSKVTAFLWKEEERHWFFVVIGLDQAVHITLLFWIFETLKQ